MQQQHLISVLMENEAGSLSRLVGLFSQRGYNIVTLNGAPTDDPSISRLTVTTITSPERIEQITKQLHKLIEVVKIIDLNEGDHIERELMLVKVRAIGVERDEMMRLTEIFRGSIIDVTNKSYTIELTGTSSKLDAFLESIDNNTVLETMRTGACGIGRGEWVLRV